MSTKSENVHLFFLKFCDKRDTLVSQFCVLNMFFLVYDKDKKFSNNNFALSYSNYRYLIHTVISISYNK